MKAGMINRPNGIEASLDYYLQQGNVSYEEIAYDF